VDLLEHRAALEQERLAQLGLTGDAQEHVALDVVALDHDLADAPVPRGLLDVSLERLHLRFLG